MSVEPTTKDKQITIEVPEDRVAEFYAFYGRFLAGHGHRNRHCHGYGPHGHRSGRGRHGEARTAGAQPAGPQQAGLAPEGAAG